MSKEKISLIIPCYNEEESIVLFYKATTKIEKQMPQVEFEYIYIDDGSKDKTLSILKRLNSKNKRVKYISFTRNFGKEAGMYAGLKEATGDYVAIMDVDMQDPPEMLPIMYKEIKKGEYDCIALYSNKHEDYNFIRKNLTKLWYKLIKKISNFNQPPGARDFRLMTRSIVDSILSLKEYNRYIKGIFDYIGYNTKWIYYEIPDRKVGTSKFNLRKLMRYAVEGITSYTSKPLIISAYIGMIFCLIAFIAILFIIGKTIIFGDPVAGWPSMTCIIIFVSGVQLFFLGVIGTYLSKIYQEVKDRPVYFIKEKSKEQKRKK